MKFNSPLSVLFAILLSECAAHQQVFLTNSKGKNKNPLNEHLEKFVEKQMEHWEVPGIAIGVVDGEDMWSSVSINSFLLVYGQG